MSSRSSVATMRVIYFVSLFPCWSETFIVREIQALLRRGVDVHIVSLKPPTESLVQSDAAALADRVLYPPHQPRRSTLALAEVVRMPLTTVRDLAELTGGLWRHPLALAKSMVAWWRMLCLLPGLRRLAPAHLHAHWATYPSTVALFAARRLGVSFSFTAHAHDIFLEDHLLARKLRAARFSVTISRFNRAFLGSRISEQAVQRMKIIHCGVPTQTYAFEPDGRDPRKILAVGRLDPIKGFTHLVEACQLLKRRGVAFECQIVGSGPLENPLRQQISAMGLVDRVRLLGALKQEEVRALLRQAAVFVLPSVVTPTGDRDGIPVALMEAMACGVPVVSTRVSGIPELVIDGQTGLLARPGHAQELADRIRQCLENPGAARQRAVAARRLVEAEFDVDVEAGKLHAALIGNHAGV